MTESNCSDKSLRGDGLAFFGKIVSGQSHEVTNVLSIINELAGLQKDILQAAERGHALDIQKLAHASDRIRYQVGRGQMIIKNVSRFAHGAEAPIAVFDVRETLSRIVFLSERWTRLRGTKLVSEFPDDSTALEASPFLFWRVVFLCIDVALVAATEERAITVSYSVTNAGPEVVVTSADPVPLNAEFESKVATLRALLDELGGELIAQPGDRGKESFVFSISGTRQRSAGCPPRQERIDHAH